MNEIIFSNINEDEHRLILKALDNQLIRSNNYCGTYIRDSIYGDNSKGLLYHKSIIARVEMMKNVIYSDSGIEIPADDIITTQAIFNGIQDEIQNLSETLHKLRLTVYAKGVDKNIMETCKNIKFDISTLRVLLEVITPIHEAIPTNRRYVM